MAALSSNQKSNQTQQLSNGGQFDPPIHTINGPQSLMFENGEQGRFSNPSSGHLDFEPDDSPYLDFDIDGEGDDTFDFDANGEMIGDLPEIGTDGDLHDKRKSIEDQDDDDEGGGKRREGDDKSGKKPGRKPLTSEPTSVSVLFSVNALGYRLTNSAETKSTEPRCPASVQRT